MLLAYCGGKVRFQIHDAAVSRKNVMKQGNGSRYFIWIHCAAPTERPALILMTGLMGTGKSVLARSLASRLGAEILQMDVLRKEMLNIPVTDHHFAEFGQGIYSDAVTRRTYAEALSRAEEMIRLGKSVIIDASYKRREERLKAKSAAGRLDADFYAIECRCPEDVEGAAEKRLSETGGTDGGGIYQAQKKIALSTNLSAGETSL